MTKLHLFSYKKTNPNLINYLPILYFPGGETKLRSLELIFKVT
jgi:hypothetical protein